MPDSQSSEHRFDSPFATISKIGHFCSLHWRLSWLSCLNEYHAIDGGGKVGDLVFARNYCIAGMLPGEAELVSEWTGLPGEEKNKALWAVQWTGYCAILKLPLLFLCLSSTLPPWSVSFIPVMFVSGASFFAIALHASLYAGQENVNNDDVFEELKIETVWEHNGLGVISYNCMMALSELVVASCNYVSAHTVSYMVHVYLYI